ncbi:MAG: hypothetical protein ACLFP4_17400, partial [Spirochaetales bacterium]
YVYVNADPVNFVDAWGLDYVLASFDKAQEELSYTVIETDGSDNLTGQITEGSFRATNNVQTPAERRFVPVEYNGYNMFPEQFPDGTWELQQSESSTNPLIGPKKIPTNAVREVEQYEFDEQAREWVVTSVTTDGGYLIHSGTGDYTWGCIKMSDDDVAEFASVVDEALAKGGAGVLHVHQGSAEGD